LVLASCNHRYGKDDSQTSPCDASQERQTENGKSGHRPPITKLPTTMYRLMAALPPFIPAGQWHHILSPCVSMMCCQRGTSASRRNSRRWPVLVRVMVSILCSSCPRGGGLEPAMAAFGNLIRFAHVNGVKSAFRLACAFSSAGSIPWFHALASIKPVVCIQAAAFVEILNSR